MGDSNSPASTKRYSQDSNHPASSSIVTLWQSRRFWQFFDHPLHPITRSPDKRGVGPLILLFCCKQSSYPVSILGWPKLFHRVTRIFPPGDPRISLGHASEFPYGLRERRGSALEIRLASRSGQLL